MTRSGPGWRSGLGIRPLAVVLARPIPLPSAGGKWKSILTSSGKAPACATAALRMTQKIAAANAAEGPHWRPLSPLRGDSPP